MHRIAAATLLITALALPCVRMHTKLPYHKNRRSDTALFRFEENGKAGFINSNGSMVIPPKFDVGWFSEEDFVEGLSPARAADKWGFINAAGNWVMPPKYLLAKPFSEGLAEVFLETEVGARFGFVAPTGKVIIELPEGVFPDGPFSEGLAAVRLAGYVSSGKVGYIDRSGKVVIPYRFADGRPYREGLAAVVFDGHCYIEWRDVSGRGTPPSVRPETDCGGVPSGVKNPCGEGFIDKTGKVVLRFQGVRDFSEGLAAVEKDGKWGFINTHGKFSVQPRFEAARSFNEGLAAAKSDGRWGYLDHAGSWTIQPQFAKADDFSDGLALTDKGYIDKTGNGVATAKDGTAFVQGLAHVSLGDGEFGYINHRGDVVFRYHPEATVGRTNPYSVN